MKYLLLIFACLLSVCSYSQDHQALISEAEKSYAEKSYTKSVELYEKAFQLQSGTRSDYYNAACSAALTNNKVLSLNWLTTALGKGYTNFRHIRNDTDLNSLHNSKEWKSLLNDLQQRVDKIEANYDKKLQATLLTIFDDDQKYRMQIGELSQKHGFDSKEVQSLWKKIEEKDSVNLIQVKSILDQYGWVGEDKVGPQANSALFLVIQHADLSTQQKYLPLMREAVKVKKAEPSALALLEDRVALGEGKKQIYGSQIGEDSTGKSYVLPLFDPDNVDQRRNEVGLPALSSYVKSWGLTWDVEKYKKDLLETQREEKIK